MGRKKGHGIIAPVIGQVRRRCVGIELLNGHQLYGRDAQFLQIGYLFDQPPVCAAPFLRHAGVGVPGKAADVQFVHNRTPERMIQGPVALPVVQGRVNHHTLHGLRAVVARMGCRFAIIGVADQRPGIGVYQYFLTVKTPAARRFVRAENAVTVQLPVFQPRNKTVPVVKGLVDLRIQRKDVGGLRMVLPVE